MICFKEKKKFLLSLPWYYGEFPYYQTQLSAFLQDVHNTSWFISHCLFDILMHAFRKMVLYEPINKCNLFFLLFWLHLVMDLNSLVSLSLTPTFTVKKIHTYTIRIICLTTLHHIAKIKSNIYFWLKGTCSNPHPHSPTFFKHMVVLVPRSWVLFRRL